VCFFFIFSDVHVLKNTTLSQEHVILNYVLGPRDLNGAYTPASLSLRELEPEALLDLMGPLTRIVSDAPRLVSRHLGLARQVVAHFSPRTFWRRELGIAEDYSHQTWTLLDGIVKVSYGIDCTLRYRVPVLYWTVLNCKV
jgi:hypothetical protein